MAVLGLTFKPGTDDLREAPSIPNVRRLLDEGAEIIAYDPVGVENFKKIYTDVKYVNAPEEALKDADMTFIFTEWNEIKSLDLSVYEKLMYTPIIFDGRNCYKIKEAKERQIDYYSIGRKSVLNLEEKALSKGKTAMVI